MRLTKTEILALAGPAGRLTGTGKPVKDETYFFDEPKGLGVRVDAKAVAGSMSGKNYVAQYICNGVKRRMAVGACSSVTA
jgi:hypothetical protein